MSPIASGTDGTSVTRGQAVFASWVTDVLVYIVVLNLFVEYVPKVITESFTISIFTAVVLKLLIDVIAGLEHRVGGWFSEREGAGLASSRGGGGVLHPVHLEVRRPGDHRHHLR